MSGKIHKMKIHCAILLPLVLLFGQPAAGQTIDTETIAAVTTHMGTVSAICIKPAKNAPPLPTARFLLQGSPCGEENPDVLITVPGTSEAQDTAIENLLELCIQNHISIKVSGPLVKHSSGNHSITLLTIKRLELRVFDAATQTRQTIIIELE